MAANKPQVRRIGKQIHFRGNLIIPITDGNNIIPITAIDTYRTVMRKSPAALAGGVYFDADDNMYFNSLGTSGDSVIPSNVLPVGTQLDGTYRLTREVASRQFRVQMEGVTAPGAQYGTALLHAPIELSILPNKQLKITALEVLERNVADAASFKGSSSLRNITSSFTSRSFMLDFSSALYTGNGLNSMGTAPINNGALVVGRIYVIETYAPGDNFTNVGALANVAGTAFVATGTSPTNWSNGSRLAIVPQMVQSYDFFYPNLTGNPSAQWPILDDGTFLDGANPYDLGGYMISLDGLMAYIQ